MPLRFVARFVLLAALALSSGTALAQPAMAPTVPAAEGAFDEGIAAYDRADYARAYERFVASATEFGFNGRTTAAYLMAGKALYAAGQFDRAASVFGTLASTYPESRYADEARSLQQSALALRTPTEQRTVDLGVALPLDPSTRAVSQAVFNGIRLAVDDHNATNPDVLVRLVFRDTRGERAGAAVQALAAEGVAAIVGPVFSDEAIEAAEAAEAARVPLIAPLATDARVAVGRSFVFQANPTFVRRGEYMGRYAAEEGWRQLGVVVEGGTYGEAMAVGFRRAAEAAGADVAFQVRLPNRGSWGDLADELTTSRMNGVDAVYFPVTGSGAAELAAAVLFALEEVGSDARPLGNVEWEGLDASRARAAAAGAVFTQDFNVDLDAARAFDQRFLALSGVLPNRPAYAGHDVARFVIQQLALPIPEGGLAEAIRTAPLYRGLAHRLYFGGDQVNDALFIMGFQGDDSVIVE